MGIEPWPFMKLDLDIKDVCMDSRIDIAPFSAIKEGNKYILIVPDTSAWCVVDNLGIEFINKIKYSRNLGNLVQVTQRSPEDLIPLLNILYKCGVISINGRYVVDKTQFEKYKMPWLTMLLLHLTDRCNMKCEYCYSPSAYEPTTMKFDTAQKAVISALKTPSDFLLVIFHGGEPFLEFSLMKNIINFGYEEAKNVGKKILFRIQSNGTLLDKEKIEIIAQNYVDVWISLDGYQKINDQYRKFPDASGSFETILKKIELFEEVDIPLPKIVTTVTSLNSNKLPEIVLFFQKMGIKGLKFSLFFPKGRGHMNSSFAPDGLEVAKSYMRIVEYIEKREISDIAVENLLQYMSNIFLFDKIYPCLRDPCGAGLNIIAVEPDGNVYPCDCLDSPSFQIGNVCKDSLSELSASDVIKNMIKRSESLQCMNCELRVFCGCGCPNRAFWFYNTIDQAEREECKISQLLIPKLIYKIATSSPIREYFEKWRLGKEFERVDLEAI
ncbi:MAG: radical SAM protein [Theionarchaea archaeon]|nr:radical SAM protein [Theionarchaea archaeon]